MLCPCRITIGSSILDKLRSLRCKLLGGLRFRDLDGESVIRFRDVPYELEAIALNWLQTVPVERRDTFARAGNSALTEEGWGCFVDWMVMALLDAQRTAEFPRTVLQALATAIDGDT